MTNPLPPLPLVEGALFVSSSFLDLPCPTEQSLYKLHARVPSGDKAGMLFGGHMHTAWSLWYRLDEYGLSEEEKMSRIGAVLTDEFTKQPQAEGDWRHMGWAMEVFKRYVEKYRGWEMEVMRWEKPQQCKRCQGTGKVIAVNSDGQPYPCLWCNGTGQTRVMSEVPFVVKLMDFDAPNEWNYHTKEFAQTIPIYFHGFIDLLVRNPAGNIFPLDFKTDFMLDAKFWDSMSSSPQLTGYCWAWRELTGITPHGYLIKGIRSAEPPIYVQKNEPKKRGGGEYKDVTDWWEKNIQHQRFDLGEGQMEEWADNARLKVETFLWHYSRGVFPQQKSLCVRKHGRCAYYQLCNHYPPHERSMLLASDIFTDKEIVSHILNTK